MEEWVAMFKQNPIGATLGVAGTAIFWWWKNRQEKQIDNREVARLTDALVQERGARVEAEEARDAAIAKQIEQVERYSEMRAQNERLLERMETLSASVQKLTEENSRQRDNITALTTQVASLGAQNGELAAQVRKLQSTLDAGTQL